MKLSKNYPLVLLEFLGIGVLILVILAMIVNRSMLDHASGSVLLASCVMFASISLLSVTSLIRTFGYTNYQFLVILGVVLLGIGGLTFYFIPQFFFYAISVPFSFWCKVSFYTLPAICVEGGIMTLFTVFMEKGTQKRTQRERLLLSITFIAYAVITVATNFLAINKMIPVMAHLLFSRCIVAMVLIITAHLIVFRNKPSHIIW